ncbi:MAG: translation initiation factor IF-3 [Elusimicrobia bacterium]|nr:translation initiation factor IF-3 [Elusimicrobiota bacterium]
MKSDFRNQPKRNMQIRASSVRLIDNDGTMVGVKPLQDALALARTRGMDLVEIAPQANPPVCKVLDFSKYLYELDKKQREARKKQKAGSLKEIRLKPRISPHDLETKIKHAEEFLSNKDKVRLTVVFRGRENQHKDLGQTLLDSAKAKLEPVAAVEGVIQLLGNRMSITFAPKQQQPSKAQVN